MTDPQLSPGLRDTVARIIAARTVPETWRHFADHVESLGMKFLLYGGSRLPSQRMLGDIRDALILHRGPQGYADAYLNEELYLHSPTLDWAERNSGAASWAEAGRAPEPREITPQQMRIMQLNVEYGATGGYVVSLRDVVPGMSGVIGMSPGVGGQARADAIWAVHGADIQLLCNLMHLRLGALPQSGQRRPLTSRQREALDWFSQGKTTQDIATIMGLSPATIEKHLKMARDALDAQTTAHAVQKATVLNLLHG